MRKFYQFCALVLIVAATTGILFPHLLKNHFSNTNSLLAGTMYFPHIPELATPSTASAWSETGATVLPLAAQIMEMRNHAGVRLDADQKDYLRPLFGNLVDRVRVVYQAQLLDRWSHGGKEMHLGGIDSSAQTYCDRIYIRAGYKSHDTNLLVLLAHELTHTQQCDRLGGISKFGARYFQGYFHSGQEYEDNPLEQSARQMEEKFTYQLCDKIGCPPKSGSYYTNYQGWGVKLPVNL